MLESSTAQQRIEHLFVSLLRRTSELDDFEVVSASDRDVRVGPLHCYILCSEAKPLHMGSQLFQATVDVVVVSNMDDSSNEERQKWSLRVHQALTEDASPVVEDTGHLLGWTITDTYENSEDQQTGDVFHISCGAAVGV